MKVTFGSRREEYNRLRFLTDGQKAITLPHARVLHNAISELSKDHSQRNLDYLFSIAENNKYGINTNSGLRKYLEKNSPIAGSLMENNNWDNALKSATEIIIKKLPKNKQELHQRKFNRIFIQEKNLTKAEKNLIKYREYIINTKDFKNAYTSNKEEATKALMHMDFFIASSETSMQEKTYIMSKLARFMSDKYKINAQLKNKKFQAFSEIINDLIVKNPNLAEFTTKNCSQEQHGSCAAISVARKALVYEDKKAYIDTILSEIDNKPYMEIYDVTRLLEYKNDEEKYQKERAPKIKVNKARINYDRAEKEGYRIIDASVLNWMKIAGTVGDGSIELQDYIAFDALNKGFMHDTRYVKDLDADYQAEHNLLRTLIKSKQLLKSYNEHILKQKIQQHEFSTDKQYLSKKISIAHKEIKNIITNIAPDKSEKEINSVISKLWKSNSINTRNTDNILKEQLSEYFLKNLGQNYQREIKASIKDILSPTKDLIKYTKIFNANISNNSQKADEAKRLYKLGIAQFEVAKHLLELEGYVENFYDEYNLPDRTTQIKNEVRKLIHLIKTKPQSTKIKELEALNNISTKELNKMLNDFDKKLTTEIPEKMDEKLAIYKTNRKTVMLDFINATISSHKENDYSYMYDVEERLKTRFTPNSFEKLLNKVKSDITKAKTNDELTNAISQLGHIDQYQQILYHVNILTSAIAEFINKGENKKAFAFTNTKITNEDIKKLANVITQTNKEISELANNVEIIAKKIGYPNEKEVVLREAERRGELPNRKIIEELSEKFDAINTAKKHKKNMLLQNKEYTIPNSLYVFTDTQKETLNNIKRNLSKFNRDINRSYKTANQNIKEKLENLYEEIGKRKGFFWVGEEGHSGLYDAESIRIMEQMTGRPYYKETNLDTAIKKIKNGEGSGTSSSMVSHDEFSGHAQYVADVKPILYKDPKTNKLIQKDVIFHDNTWGHSEKFSAWTDNLGIRRTNYGNGLGGKQGFILDDSLLQGEYLDDYKYEIGFDTSDRTNKATEGALLEIQEASTPYTIMENIRLQGIDKNALRKIGQMHARIFNLNNIDKKVDDLIKASKIAGNQIQLEKIEKADERLYELYNLLQERIVKNDKPAITIKEFNALPNNDELKIIVNKLICRKAFDDLEDNLKLGDIKTEKGLISFKEKKLKEFKKLIYDILGKDISSYSKDILDGVRENLIPVLKNIEKEHNTILRGKTTEILSVIKEVLKEPFDGSTLTLMPKIENKIKEYLLNDDKISILPRKNKKEIIDIIKETIIEIIYPETIEDLKDSEDGEKIIKVFDKFNPYNDDALIELISVLIETPKKDIEKFVESLSLEDFGIEFDSPENVIKLIQAGNTQEQKLFEDEVRYHFFEEFIPTKANKNKISPINKELADFNRKYRSFSIDLSSIGGEKYIKENKESVFEKYQVRPAIPQLKIYSPEELQQATALFLNQTIEKAIKARNYNLSKNYLILLDKLNNQTALDGMALPHNEIKNTLIQMTELVELDKEFKQTPILINKILNELDAEKINKLAIRRYVSGINKESKNIFKNATTENLNESFLAEKTDLKNMIKSIDTNVLPRYQGEAKRLLNECLKTFTKNPTKEENKKLAEDVINFISHRHIVTDPEQLLAYTVKIASNPVPPEMEEEKETKLNVLKGYLKEAYKKANKAHLEYELMSAARNGFASKIKDLTKNNKMMLKLSNGKEISAMSPDGMAYIIQGLADNDSNHSTLMLFLEQAGLVDTFIETMNNNPPETIKEVISKLTSNFLIGNEQITRIEDEFNEFIKTIPEDIIYKEKSDDEFIKKILNVFIEKLDKIDFNNKFIFFAENYKETLKNIDFNANIGARMVDIVKICHNYAIDTMNNGLDSLLDEINANCNTIKIRYSLMANLKLVEDSTDDKNRNEYLEKLNQVAEFANQSLDLIEATQQLNES